MFNTKPKPKVPSLAALAAQVAAMEATIKLLHERVSSSAHDPRVSSVEATINALTEKVGKVSAFAERVDARALALDSAVDGVVSALNTIGEKVAAHDEQLSAVSDILEEMLAEEQAVAAASGETTSAQAEAPGPEASDPSPAPSPAPDRFNVA